MTLIMIIGGVLLITYAIVNAYCPTVDKDDIELESYETPEIRHKPIEVMKVTEVERCYSPGVRNDSIEEICDASAAIYTYYDVPLSDEIQQYIQDQCLEKFGTLELCGYNLPKLVINIIRWESGFDAENDNGKCCGLMSVTHKLSDAIREEENITNLIEPAQNIRAGVHILKMMYDHACEFLKEHGHYMADEYKKERLIDLILDWYHNGYHSTSFGSEYIDNIKSTYGTTKERSKQ